MILVKVDVSKVDKARLFAGKNGAKYLDLVLIETKDDKYGNDYMVKQSISKQERESGVRLPIIGNAKIMRQRSENPPPSSEPLPADTEEPIPF